MGARGPAPKPAELRLIEGGTAKRGAVSHKARIDRPVQGKIASGEIPKEYSWLGRIAKDYWKREAPQLVALGLLRVTDLAAWMMCCCAYEDYIRARREGLKAKDAEDRWKYWARKFGLTPGDRAGLQAPGLPPGGNEKPYADEFS